MKVCFCARLESESSLKIHYIPELHDYKERKIGLKKVRKLGETIFEEQDRIRKILAESLEKLEKIFLIKNYKFVFEKL